MKNFGKFVLGAAIVAGGLGIGATSAQAAEFRVVIGGPVAYVSSVPWSRIHMGSRLLQRRLLDPRTLELCWQGIRPGSQPLLRRSPP